MFKGLSPIDHAPVGEAETAFRSSRGDGNDGDRVVFCAPFRRIVAFTLGEEGGYSDDAHDTGGATNFGITHADYDAWRKLQGLPPESVKHLTQTVAREIYWKRYWIAGRCPLLPSLVAMVHFDTAVNCGLLGAARLLQHALLTVLGDANGISGKALIADGVIGDRTVSAAARCDKQATCAAYLDERVAHYHAIVAARPADAVFLGDWLRRVEHLRAFVAALPPP